MAAEDDDKTEEPTPKKIEDAKKEGNVPKSMEVTGAAVLLFGSVYLLFFSGNAVDHIKKLMLFVYGLIGQDMTGNTFYVVGYNAVVTLLITLMPLFVLVILLVLISNWTQFGFVATPMKFDLQKIDPIKGLKGVFGLKKALEALKLTKQKGKRKIKSKKKREKKEGTKR